MFGVLEWQGFFFNTKIGCCRMWHVPLVEVGNVARSITKLLSDVLDPISPALILELASVSDIFFRASLKQASVLHCCFLVDTFLSPFLGPLSDKLRAR